MQRGDRMNSQRSLCPIKFGAMSKTMGTIGKTIDRYYKDRSFGSSGKDHNWQVQYFRVGDGINIIAEK